MSRARPDPLALSVAALAFAVSAPVIYILQRLFEQIRGGGGNPGMILRTAHMAYFWRVSIALWCAGLVAIFAYGRVSPVRATRASSVAIAASLIAAVIAVAFALP